MSAYIKGLRSYVEQENAFDALKAADLKAAARATRELKPLHERLTKLLATIPVEVQSEGLSLPTLASRLRGRGGGEANAGQLGTALRRLGWRRERRWRGGDVGFSAMWFPPAAYKA